MSWAKGAPKGTSGLCITPPRRADERIVKREGYAAFLERSTLPVARRIRTFVNGNLAKLPPDARRGICRGIRSPRFHQANLELIVGRTLQVLGATGVAYEPKQPSGKRPDFLATFVDGQVFVDATHPDWNAVFDRRHRANQRLIDAIEAMIPPGWSFMANRLPVISGSAPLGPFRRAVTRAFADLPPPVGTMSVRLTSADDGCDFELEVTSPRVSQERAWRAGPAHAEFVAPDLQIRAALHGKRSQLRGLRHPALVALGGTLGADREDYQIALFGRTVGEVDHSGRETSHRFERSGLFATAGRDKPTIAGVLAYIGMDVSAGADPIVYLHPRFTGTLPDALLALELHTLEADGPQLRAASVHGIFDRLSRTTRGR